MNKKILIGVGIVIIVAVAALVTFKVEHRSKTVASDQATSTVKLYRSETYGFQVMYPLDWTVSENPSVPAISIHKKSEPENATYGITGSSTAVTIYPKGFKTDLFFGLSQDSKVSYLGATSTLTDYFLLNGNLWAEKVQLAQGPTDKGWTKDAFIWAGLAVKDSSWVCLYPDKTEHPEVNCEGDLVHSKRMTVRKGSVALEDGAVLGAILQSFSFIK